MKTIIVVGLLCAMAGQARADMAREDLYYARNQIYREAGYCFKTSRAIRTFGNAGCSYDDVNDVPLSNASRQRAAYLARQERQLGCPQ